MSKLSKPRICQAEGCCVDLSLPGTKPYCRKRQLCLEHIKAEYVQRKGCGNGLWRFCQQCGKLEPLHQFQGNKRSCKQGLIRRRQTSNGSEADLDAMTFSNPDNTINNSHRLVIAERLNELQQQADTLNQLLMELRNQTSATHSASAMPCSASAMPAGLLSNSLDLTAVPASLMSAGSTSAELACNDHSYNMQQQQLSRACSRTITAVHDQLSGGCLANNDVLASPEAIKLYCSSSTASPQPVQQEALTAWLEAEAERLVAEILPDCGQPGSAIAQPDCGAGFSPDAIERLVTEILAGGAAQHSQPDCQACSDMDSAVEQLSEFISAELPDGFGPSLTSPQQQQQFQQVALGDLTQLYRPQQVLACYIPAVYPAPTYGSCHSSFSL